jgi:hypothetical protein
MIFYPHPRWVGVVMESKALSRGGGRGFMVKGRAEALLI